MINFNKVSYLGQSENAEFAEMAEYVEFFNYPNIT